MAVAAPLLFLAAPLIGAQQQIPTPAQAQQMIKTDPGLIARLQQMMQASGLTPDQVRQRLKAAGYSDSLLDQYLPGATQDSTAMPNDQVFAAVKALGIADSTLVDSLSASVRTRKRAVARVDSAFLDTVQKALNDTSTAKAVRSLLQSRELLRDQADSGFNVFGRDLFQGQTTLFDANTGGSADPNYRFGPGDRLVLFLTGDVEASYPLTVTREGFVVIPQVGQVSVAGLTRAQLEDALFSRLRNVYSGVRRSGATTHFYVDVAQMGMSLVFVHGDVEHPGSYRVSRAATALTALYQAGGPSATGSLRNVLVRRNNETVATLDFYDYALHGDPSNDVRLENGDVVFVATRGPRVRVAGHVVRPATYELRGQQTLGQVLEMAGGFTESADRRRVQIERIVPPNERTTAGTDRKTIDVEADLIATAPVRGGDVVKVTEIAKRVANRVGVIGNVWRPGPVAFVPGMTLEDALRRVGGLKPDSYLGDVLVTRLQADSTRTMLHTALYDTTGKAVRNIPLSDADEIQIFSTTDFRPLRYITIGGSVRKPGPIAFRDGMTIRDAILLAGGTLEGALLTEAEVARLPENRAAGVTAVTMIVQLDSTYIVERGANGRLVAPPGLALLPNGTPDFVLHPYDAILIKRQPEWQLQQSVWIDGEVKYPGPYSLTTKTDHVTDILKRAGGLTTAAYPDGIIFIRRRDAIGRIGIDLPRVLRNTRDIDNLQLVDGDSIYIPRYSPVVTVRGNVQSQVGVSYVDGADLDYYVRSAGGPTNKGDRGRAYVTQPNGKVEVSHRRLGLWHSEPRPQPGSTVVVPEKDPADKTDWLGIATAMTGLVGSLVAIAALLKK